MAEWIDAGVMELVYAFLMSPVSAESNSLLWGHVLIILGVISFIAVSAGK